MTEDEITRLALSEGWAKTNEANGGVMMTFVRTVDGKEQKIEIWPSRMTVATMVDHPRQGKTKLYRRHVSEKVLKKIFRNPRVHTTGGYKTKDQRPPWWEETKLRS